MIKAVSTWSYTTEISCLSALSLAWKGNRKPVCRPAFILGHRRSNPLCLLTTLSCRACLMAAMTDSREGGRTSSCSLCSSLAGCTSIPACASSLGGKPDAGPLPSLALLSSRAAKLFRLSSNFSTHCAMSQGKPNCELDFKISKIVSPAHEYPLSLGILAYANP